MNPLVFLLLSTEQDDILKETFEKMYPEASIIFFGDERKIRDRNKPKKYTISKPIIQSALLKVFQQSLGLIPTTPDFAQHPPLVLGLLPVLPSQEITSPSQTGEQPKSKKNIDDCLKLHHLLHVPLIFGSLSQKTI